MIDYSKIDQTQLFDHSITYALKAFNNTETLYMHEGLKAPDEDHFKKAIIKEVNDHTRRENWETALKAKLPDKMIILPVLWEMRRKNRNHSRETYK
jgi:hypothetical protein